MVVMKVAMEMVMEMAVTMCYWIDEETTILKVR